ncbi:MAG: alkaline phosphatase PhoX [Gemmatimonas sp.]
MTVDRRNFLRTGAKYAGGAIAAPSLIGLMACNDVSPAEPDGVARLARAQRGNGGYGPLAADPDGLPFLIPAGFTLRQISKAGNPMKRPGQGNVPNALDGMAAFNMPNGNIRLIRNHEIRDGAANSVPMGAKPWDSKPGAGCTSLEVLVDPNTKEPTVIDEFVSISGTCVNCAGGPTPWGSWLTCEETTEGTTGGRLKNHGYVFEIPVSAMDEIEAVSLNAMGRFAHEAVAVDPVYGHVYETEDAGNNSGFYRFIPNVLGDLKQGGQLQMLALTGKPQYNSTGGGTPTGVPLPAEWVDVANPDSVSPSCFNQGLALGGTRFARLEGCWWGDNSVYFNATSGGAAGAGQVWQYRPITANAGQLVLVFESPSTSVLDAPDNICVSPRGGLVICEDGGGTQFLRGLTKQGAIFDFVRAANPNSATEFAGACFSPDGNILFFNTQGSTERLGTERGGTFAIWGPWTTGAL